MANPLAAKPLFLTWAGLMALTGITLGLSFAPLGAWEMPVALTLAATKASLVFLFFMHLVTQRWSNRIVVIVTVFFVFLLVAFMVADIVTRTAPPLLPPGVQPVDLGA
jgi:cytochrome c oxidase subunit IV